MEIVLTLLAIFILLLIVALPVMLAASWLGAANTGFRPALIAVIVAGLVSIVIDAILGEGLIGVVVSGAVGALIYANILGTTFWRGLGISIVSTLILFGAFIVLAGLFAGASI
ncbi:MAG: hypothetical protein AAGC71_10405 [Pseudomonadota bacterium]